MVGNVVWFLVPEPWSSSTFCWCILSVADGKSTTPFVPHFYSGAKSYCICSKNALSPLSHCLARSVIREHTLVINPAARCSPTPYLWLVSGESLSH